MLREIRKGRRGRKGLFPIDDPKQNPDYEGIQRIVFYPIKKEVGIYMVNEGGGSQRVTNLNIQGISTPEDEGVKVIVHTIGKETYIEPPDDYSFLSAWLDRSSGTLVFWNDPIRLIP